MKLLNNWRIKHKLVLILFFPLISVIYLSSLLILEKFSIYQEMTRLEDINKLSLKISDVLHATQQERDLSALYVKSQGKEWQIELERQIVDTQAMVGNLQQFINELSERIQLESLLSAFQKLRDILPIIVQVRQQVKQQIINEHHVIEEFSKINENLISIINDLAAYHEYADFLKADMAYLNLLIAKEKAALERALLSAVFKQRYFEPGEFQRFITLVTQQDTYLLATSSRYTSMLEHTDFTKVLQDPVMKKVEQLRQLAYDASIDGVLQVTIEDTEGKTQNLAEYWFKVKTQKIDLFKIVEDKLTAYLMTTTHEAGKKAYFEFLIVLLTSISIIIFTLFIVYFLSLGITQRLTKAVNIANSIARGKLDNEFIIDANDETGQLLFSFDNMQRQLRTQIENERIMAENALRINEALDNVTTSVLIADNDYNIIFLNKAAHQFFEEREVNFRQELPHFNAKQLLNRSVDALHKNPHAHRQLLSQLTGSQHAQLDLSNLTIEYYVTPVINQRGERLGVVKEFKDRTIEVATEHEINQVIHTASQGDFSGRIALTNKNGFFRAFAEGLNQILDYNQLAIQDIMQVFAALAKGDLTRSIENEYLGALDQVKQDANISIQRLNEVMIAIQQSANVVNQAAAEISQGHISLSQRTEEQAASLEETAASMEEMTSTVQQNADNASQATQLAASARNYAEQGSIVVNNAVQSMVKINDSSKRIADIIGVIDEIAFQTNLLALNAAVEAARAGEQGRGFAVVATEVRNLAQRSAVAAKEIKSLIRDSVNKVEEGTCLVNQSGETLLEIVIAVKKVSDIIAEIAAASQEQSSGIQQVNKAIAQMDEMTQQNAALVEEAAAAGEAMSHESLNLREQISFFRIHEQYFTALKQAKTVPTPAAKIPAIAKTKTKAKAKPDTTGHKKRSSQKPDDGWEDF